MSEFTLAPPAPRGLGRAMLGGGEKVDRMRSDFYPTPVEVTRALLRVGIVHGIDLVAWAIEAWENRT